MLGVENIDFKLNMKLHLIKGKKDVGKQGVTAPLEVEDLQYMSGKSL